mmetsp:Transcript_32601/g.103888  ORF Transcript_32601/g.103888 Transcript_32601/m.103888 type:complete len:143 (-) Transcript_32601:4-432(-)
MRREWEERHPPPGGKPPPPPRAKAFRASTLKGTQPRVKGSYPMWEVTSEHPTRDALGALHYQYWHRERNGPVWRNGTWERLEYAAYMGGPGGGKQRAMQLARNKNGGSGLKANPRAWKPHVREELMETAVVDRWMVGGVTVR